MTESQITTEANNVTPPLKNTNAMKCIWNGIAGPSVQTLDMRTVMGATNAYVDGSHYLTLAADGRKVYVAFGSSAGTIDPNAIGNGITVCWPIPDGTTRDVRPVSGYERATGVSTLCAYNVLHYTTGTGASSGYLRLYRSSLGPGQDAGEFKAP